MPSVLGRLFGQSKASIRALRRSVCRLAGKGFGQSPKTARPSGGMGVAFAERLPKKEDADCVNCLVLQGIEAQLRRSISQSPAAVAIFDRQMRYLPASSRWKRDMRVEGDILGRSHYDVFPDVSERWRDIHRRGLAGETCSADRELSLRADGSSQWTQWEVLPWRRLPMDAIGGVVIHAEDITGLPSPSRNGCASTRRETPRGRR